MTSVDEKTHRILIVDDMPTVRLILRGMLEPHSLGEIEEAEDGESALQAIREALRSRDAKPFTLVIADLNMPGMSGADLLRVLRSESRLKELRFIMVTAQSAQAVVADAWQSDVDDFVVKPFTAEDLAEKVRAVLREDRKTLPGNRQDLSG